MKIIIVSSNDEKQKQSVLNLETEKVKRKKGSTTFPSHFKLEVDFLQDSNIEIYYVSKHINDIIAETLLANTDAVILLFSKKNQDQYLTLIENAAKISSRKFYEYDFEKAVSLKNFIRNVIDKENRPAFYASAWSYMKSCLGKSADVLKQSTSKQANDEQQIPLTQIEAVHNKVEQPKQKSVAGNNCFFKDEEASKEVDDAFVLLENNSRLPRLTNFSFTKS